MNSPSSKDKKYQDYYADEDYDQILAQLPDIVQMASDRAQEVMEPTINEKKEVRDFIFDFLRQKKRKIYGGTAMDTLLKAADPKARIYTDMDFADIDFYSPKPVFDLVELTNQLYEKGYKFVQGKEAQHEESFSVYVNMHMYCQISYVPTRVYKGIQTIVIDGLHYTHPHFIYIDQFRMFNDPMNSAWRWEKAFKRTYLLLKHYPFEYHTKKIHLKPPSQIVSDIVTSIKTKFMADEKIQSCCMISGFDAYNFFIKHAANDRSSEKMARATYPTSGTSLTEMIVPVPYMELISVNYKEAVKQAYKFLQETVPDKSLLGIDEYFPLFQYFNFMAVITYDKQPVLKIYESDGMCVSMIKTTKGYSYVSFQYLMLYVMISKFRSYIDELKDMYFTYSIILSNLIKARNIYLTNNNLDIINKSVFGEFKVSCMGTTVSLMRASQIKRLARIAKGHAAQFTYEPKRFIDKSVENPPKFEPTKLSFKNTSGNQIMVPKFLTFGLDSNGILIDRKDIEAYESSEEEEDDDNTDKDKSTDKSKDKSKDD